MVSLFRNKTWNVLRFHAVGAKGSSRHNIAMLSTFVVAMCMIYKKNEN